jgi:predicted RNA-binding protein with PUA-like domain
MRDSMSRGDKVLFYHSNCSIPWVVGIAEIVGESHTDETQFDPTSDYYDPKSSRENPRWICRAVRFVEKFPTIVSLATVRSIPELANMRILQKWNRLSITEVTEREYSIIVSV